MRILDQALKHERYFTALTGLRINEFQRLVEEVTPALRDARLAFLLDRKPMPQRKRQMGGGRKNVFPSVEEQLFLFLFWARTYPTLLCMEILFGADEVTFWRINQRMSLQIAAHSKIMLPDPGRKRIRSLEELKESFPDIYEVIVDATEQRIQRPGDKRKNKKYRSGKKKAHTVKTQILVDATRGAILHVSETVEGKRHDFRLFKDTVTPMATGGSVRLLGDSGYQGIATQRPHLSAMTSRKRFRGAPPLTRKEKRANRLFARVRVRVEHAFARLKQFKVLAGTYRHTIRIYNVVFRSIATLTNFRLQMRTEVA